MKTQFVHFENTLGGHKMEFEMKHWIEPLRGCFSKPECRRIRAGFPQ